MTEATETQGLPRLSTIHLVGATTCIAIHLAVSGALGALAERPDVVGRQFFWLLNSIASGLSLGGLLVFFSRRIQRIAFPHYPGEWLWVVLGIGVVFSLLEATVQAIVQSAVHRGVLEEYSDASPWLAILGWPLLLASWALLLLCLVRVDAHRWRGFFATVLVMFLVDLIGGWFGMTILQSRLCRVCVVVVLLGVVAADVREGKEYAWTHWCGIVIWVWFFIASVLPWLVRSV